MRKKTTAFLLILVVIALFMTLVGCETTALSFSSSSYTVRVGTSFSPNVIIKPKGNDYELTAGNSTIVTVGNNIVTVNREGVVTLTATSGKKEATTTLYCVTDQTIDPSDVRFVTTYTVSFEIVNYADAGLETGYLESVYAYEGSFLNVNLPNLSGYSLDGWYLDRACTSKYDLESPVLSSFTLYANLTALATDFTVANNLVTGLLYPNLPHEELTLPASKNGAPVYGIADEAFQGDTGIRRVILPETYRTIGTSAFAGCENLEEVVVPEGCALTTIGANAFGVVRDEYDRITSGCEKLTSIDLPDTVTRVGSFAFYNCKNLTLSGIPSGLTTLEQYAFSGTKINGVSLRNVVQIAEGAFYDCKELDTVTDTTSVGQCAKRVFSGTKLESDARTRYGSSPNNEKDDNAAYYAGTILYGCYDYYGTMGGSGKLRVKEGTTLIADEAFNDRHQSELTLYLTVESATQALNRDFIGKNVFYDADGVFVVVPEEVASTYRNRYDENNEGRNYKEYFVTETILSVEGNVDTVNWGRHVLLKKVSADGTEYFYDKYLGADGGTAKHIMIGQLDLAYDVVRINMNAFCGISTLRTLGVGRVKSIAYYAVSDCGKTTETEVIDGVDTPVQKNYFTRLDLTETVSPTVLESVSSVRFDDMPVLYAYVKSGDMTAYASVWQKFSTALSRLIGE